MYCSNCGQRLTDDAKHCPNCGMLIIRDSGTAAPDHGSSAQDARDPFQEYSYGPEYRGSGYSAAPQTTKEDGYALTALILSIISGVCCCLPVVGLPCAVIGIIFAVKGMKSVERRGMAVVALIFSIIFAVCNAVIVISLIISLANADTWAEIMEGFNFDMDDFSRFYR